jgi:hypothetical protein
MMKQNKYLTLKNVLPSNNYSDSEIHELNTLLGNMSEESRSDFVTKALMENLVEAKYRQRLKDNPSLPELSETKADGFLMPIPDDRPVLNDDIENVRGMYNLRNNEIKELFGISDAKITTMKKRPQDPVDDPTVAIILRIFTKRPELFVERLVPSYDLKGIIHWLGGVDRHVGVYLGRNFFSGYRYMQKGQKGTVSINIVKGLLVRFLKEDKLTDYIDVLQTEARARGIADIFEHGKWQLDKE